MANQAKRAAPVQVVEVVAKGQYLHLDNLLKDAEGMAEKGKANLRLHAERADDKELAFLVADYMRGLYRVDAVEKAIRTVTRLNQMF